MLRALRILGQLGSDGLTLTDLAGRVGLPVPTTLRLVRTLEAADYVERRNNVIVLGTGVLRLAAAMDSEGAFGWAVKAATKRLRDRTQETACVYVRDGTESVAVSIAHAERDVRWVPTMGERFPLWYGGPADVLVAFGPTQRILTELRHDNERHGWTPDDLQWSDVDALSAIAEETRRAGLRHQLAATGCGGRRGSGRRTSGACRSPSSRRRRRCSAPWRSARRASVPVRTTRPTTSPSPRRSRR